MAAPSLPLPKTIDGGGRWFWNFLKQELTPYPGRAWVVGRVTISATIVMILVMTFRIPGGFFGAIFTIFLSRENPTTTLRDGFPHNHYCSRWNRLPPDQYQDVD